MYVEIMMASIGDSSVAYEVAASGDKEEVMQAGK